MKKSFIVYTDNIEFLEELTDEQLGQLYKAQIAYARGEAAEIEDKTVRLAFKLLKGQMDRDAEKYEQVINIRSEAGKRGGINSGKARSKAKQNEANEANACFASKNEANEANAYFASKNEANEAVTVTVTDNVTVNDIKEKRVKEKASGACFTPPTVDEVREYITEKGYNINPEGFVDFYTSKGWLVGNVKMKDWRAAVRTWKSRSLVRSPSATPPNRFNNFKQREDTDIDDKAMSKSLKLLGVT